jgi:hypothetical protein
METFDRNKSAIMTALAAAGITSVVVTFDGYGDNGQIESLEVLAGETTVELPASVVLMAAADDEEPVKSADEKPLAEAIETLCFDYLSHVYAGWEINAGAYGTFTFTVADNSVELDFSKRFEDEENSSYRF